MCNEVDDCLFSSQCLPVNKKSILSQCFMTTKHSCNQHIQTKIEKTFVLSGQRSLDYMCLLFNVVVLVFLMCAHLLHSIGHYRKLVNVTQHSDSKLLRRTIFDPSSIKQML